MSDQPVPYWSGARIEYLRQLLGSAANPLNYNELAEVLAAGGFEVHPKTIARWERDERVPEVSDAILMAAAAGVSVGWFVLGFEAPPPLPHGVARLQHPRTLRLEE